MPIPGTAGDERFCANLINGLDSIAEAIKAQTVAIREQSELLREIAGKLKDRSPEPITPGGPDAPIHRGPTSKGHLPPGISPLTR